jgi:hypothetical protein
MRAINLAHYSAWGRAGIAPTSLLSLMAPVQHVLCWTYISRVDSCQLFFQYFAAALTVLSAHQSNRAGHRPTD